MGNAPLTLRFASDVDAAKKGVASLAVSIASNMATVAGTALTAGRTVVSAGNSIISTYQAMSRASALVVPTLGALALGIGAITAAWMASTAVQNLAKERLEAYVDIANKAAAGGVSAEFFQRQAKAAKAYQVSVDDVAKSLENFRATTSTKLGGGEFDKRLEELTVAGNFKNNTGVAAYKSANTEEERYRAIVSLITQAGDQGERLAGLDLAAKFLPPTLLDRLKSSSDFLATMQKDADAVAKTKIVSDEDVARAVDLTHRLDEAHKTLALKFKPIQDDLVQLGLNYQESWVSIVESMATAVDHANSIYRALSNEPQWLKDLAQSPVWRKFVEATTSAESRKAAEKAYGITPIDDSTAVNNPDGPEMFAAKNRLRTGLINPASVRLAAEQSTNVAFAARKDTSKVPKPEEAKQALDQVERMISMMEKANDTLKVELDTEGKSNVEREKGIALAKAEAAARLAQRDLTADERSKVLALAEAHAVLANKLKDVQQALAANAESARFFGNAASNALADVFIDGQKVNDVILSIAKQWGRLALQAAFTGQGAFASMLGFAPLASQGSNAVGGITGIAMNALGLGGRNPYAGSTMSTAGDLGAGTGGMAYPMFRAGGGDVERGRAYRVGEVRDEIFVPGANGRIYPIGQNGINGGNTFAPVYQINAPGADSGTIARIEQVLDRHARVITSQGAAMISAQREQATGVN